MWVQSEFNELIVNMLYLRSSSQTPGSTQLRTHGVCATLKLIAALMGRTWSERQLHFHISQFTLGQWTSRTHIQTGTNLITAHRNQPQPWCQNSEDRRQRWEGEREGTAVPWQITDSCWQALTTTEMCPGIRQNISVNNRTETETELNGKYK